MLNTLYYKIILKQQQKQLLMKMSAIINNNNNNNYNNDNKTATSSNNNNNNSLQRCPHGTNCRFQERAENPCPKSHVQIDQQCPYERHSRGTCSQNMRGPGYCLFTGGHRNSGHVLNGTVPMQLFTSAPRANQQPRQGRAAAFFEQRRTESDAITRSILEKRAARLLAIATKQVGEVNPEPILLESRDNKDEAKSCDNNDEDKSCDNNDEDKSCDNNDEAKSCGDFSEDKSCDNEDKDEPVQVVQLAPRPSRLVVVGEITWIQAKDEAWCDVTALTHLTEKAIWATVNNQTYRRNVSLTDPRIVPEPVEHVTSEPVEQVRPERRVVSITSGAGTMHYMKSKNELWYDVTNMFIRYSSCDYVKPLPQLIWTQLHNDISQSRITALASAPF